MVPHFESDCFSHQILVLILIFAGEDVLLEFAPKTWELTTWVDVVSCIANSFQEFDMKNIVK